MLPWRPTPFSYKASSSGALDNVVIEIVLTSGITWIDITPRKELLTTWARNHQMVLRRRSNLPRDGHGTNLCKPLAEYHGRFSERRLCFVCAKWVEKDASPHSCHCRFICEAGVSILSRVLGASHGTSKGSWMHGVPSEYSFTLRMRKRLR